jgi:hypothetical protein
VLLAVEGRDVDVGAGSSVLVLAWWWAPFAVNAVGARTRVGVAVTGAVLLGLTPALLVAVLRTESSTAAVGLLTVPACLVVGTVAALVAERAVLARQRAQ